MAAPPLKIFFSDSDQATQKKQYLTDYSTLKSKAQNDNRMQCCGAGPILTGSGYRLRINMFVTQIY